MSLFGTLNTAVSGLSAQANMLGTIGDNISNSSTTGYKDASVQFETLLGNQATSSYESGGVQSRVRYGISDQGAIVGTSSVTDLAVQGQGYFVVQDSSGSPALTRAGSFVPDASGNLVNTAGYTLMGYSLTNGSIPSATGPGGLGPVNIGSAALTASPSTGATLPANLPSTATAVTLAAPPGSNYTAKTSLVAYDNLGSPVTMDIYMTKTAADTWHVDVYNHADAAASGSFPYANPEIGSGTLTYDPTTGSPVAGSTTSVSVAIPNGDATLGIDMSKSTQLAAAFSAGTPSIDGSSPSAVKSIAIGNDGALSVVYQNGVQKNLYRIPLANVPAPDQMNSVSGNVYQPTLASGQMVVGTAGTGSLGKIDSSSLEQSTVDIATELTNMISAQRSYEANSKVITTSSELLSVITNLK